MSYAYFYHKKRFHNSLCVYAALVSALNLIRTSLDFTFVNNRSSRYLNTFWLISLLSLLAYKANDIFKSLKNVIASKIHNVQTFQCDPKPIDNFLAIYLTPTVASHWVNCGWIHIKSQEKCSIKRTNVYIECWKISFNLNHTYIIPLRLFGPRSCTAKTEG